MLFGGRSAEHDVSCVSAAHIVAAADPQKYTVEPVGITREGRWVRAAESARALSAAEVAAPPRRTALPSSLTAKGRPVDPLTVLTVPPAGARPQAIGAVRGKRGPTVVMPALHGPMGEDGTVQGLLEMAGVPYVGAGVMASALCMDKSMAKTVLAARGIPQARWRAFAVDGDGCGGIAGRALPVGKFASAAAAPTVRRCPTEEMSPEDMSAAAVQCLGLPVFTKPANMGSSVGVSKAWTLVEAAEAIRVAARYDRTVVVEEAVSGREIEVSVLGNDRPAASVPGEIIPGAEFYDYEDKYEGGAELLVPAPLSSDEADAARSLALKVFEALGVEGIARVDLFYEDGRDGRGTRGWMVNEVNTMPGFTPISMYPKLWDVSGLSYPKLIDQMVELALERDDRRHRHTCTRR